MATSLVAELAEKLSSATNNLDFDEQTLFLNTSADTVGIGTNSPGAKLDVRGSALFNEGGDDADFRIEGDTQTHLFFLDASTDRIGINSATPGVQFDVVGATTITGATIHTGTTQLTGAVTVGVDDTGHDVKFFGATASAYFLWDESADTLEIRGPVATPGKLLLSTAEPTVIDGNILGQIDFQAPGESGTDAIKVAASIWAEADATFAADNNATELVFATGASETATEKVRITSDGNVGIATSAPACKLSVVGSAIVGRNYDIGGYANDDFDLMVTNAGNDATAILLYNDAGGYNSGILEYHNNVFNIGLADSNSAPTVRTGSAISIAAAGVGIGTTAPAELLSVVSSAAPTRGMLELKNTSDNSAWIVSDANLSSAGSGMGGIRQYWNGTEITRMATHSGPDTTNKDDGELAFYTRASGAAIGVRMVIDPSGNVGIGTTAPDGHFHVHTASCGSQTASSTADDAVFENSAAAGISILCPDANHGNIYFGSPSDPSNGIIRSSYNSGSQTLSFGAGGNAADLLITDTGKVGIGTTTPSVALHAVNRSSSTTIFLEVVKVEGVCTGTVANGFGPKILFNGSMTGQDNVELGYLGYKNDSVGGAYGTFALYTRPNSTSVERLRVIYSGDTYTNDGTISSLSDIRAKKDVANLTDGLDIVNQLRPRTFKYNGKTSLGTDDGVTRYGFIADEVLSVASHYVNITAEDVDGERVEDFKTLSTTKMIPMLVNSIQELSAKNTALEAKVTALENA